MPFRRNPRAAALAATNGRDMLDATASGQTLHGLGGNDLLRSIFNRTTLFGDGGNDRLVTTLDFTSRATLLAGQFGGSGNDILTANVQANFEASGTDTSSEIAQDGGAGADRITAYSLALSVENDARATNTASGGLGDDFINVVAQVEGAPRNSYATNIVSGGDGNDQIKAEALGDFSGMGTYSTNRIDGGTGDDQIEAVANVNSNGGWHALNEVTGGSGDDTIIATAGAGSNDSSEIAENIIEGGAGDDSIQVNTSASFGFAELRAAVTAGAGNDTIVANTRIGADTGAMATLSFDGGLGNDWVESSVTADWSSRVIRIINRLDGYDGNDTLVARLETPAPTEENLDVHVAAVNRLDGSAGNDDMTGIVTGLGRSVFNGGSGSDVLKVNGGQNNMLSGGSGHDRMFAGNGTDQMIGGGGADDFVFDITKDHGSDRILDFDGAFDRLCFIGLSDSGARGLADDIDAITTVTDQGAGLDVVVRFESGTVVTFEGCGGFGYDTSMGDTFIDSLADLVENARTQLLVEPL